MNTPQYTYDKECCKRHLVNGFFWCPKALDCEYYKNIIKNMNASVRIEHDESLPIYSINKVAPGRHDLSATIMFPFDCSNNCKFCTTKKWYKDFTPTDQSIDELLRSVSTVCAFPFVDNIVISGGEPFSNLTFLAVLINTIRQECYRYKQDKKIYVNTSLHAKALHKDSGSFEKVINSICGSLDGMSLSSHLIDGGFSNEDTILRLVESYNRNPFVFGKDKSEFSLRLNSVVDFNVSRGKILDIIDKVFPISKSSPFDSINFRLDYTTKTAIHSSCDPIIKILGSIDDIQYEKSGSCAVCDSRSYLISAFEKRQRGRVIYHRGLENTSFIVGDTLMINDVVVMPNGEIRYDWADGSTIRWDCLHEFMHTPKLGEDLSVVDCGIYRSVPKKLPRKAAPKTKSANTANKVVYRYSCHPLGCK